TLVIASDLGQKSRTGEEVKTGQHLLTSIFQSMNDGICVVDNEYRILQVNSAVEAWFGGQRSLTDKPCRELLQGCGNACDACPVRDTLTSGGSADTVIPVSSESGKATRWLKLHSYPLIDEDTGTIEGAIIYLRDITREKYLEELEKSALEQIERNIVQLSILNDHIRNPLAVIVALAAMEGGPVMEKILAQAGEINRIITELDMGWLESEKIREFLRKHFGLMSGSR
uniref:PAS domain-containing protein n=1 Tax=Methanothrix sp. TaxID=90426 RepID=UPI0034E1AD58